uniref:Uncharacterized protein n=1 Tax=Romanomermis culicivorax TaxID=13658 RepID=A0A915IMX0_ROMCU
MSKLQTALPHEKYRQFVKFSEIFRQNRNYDEFLLKVKNLFSPDNADLFEKFRKFDLQNWQPK